MRPPEERHFVRRYITLSRPSGLKHFRRLVMGELDLSRIQRCNRGCRLTSVVASSNCSLGSDLDAASEVGGVGPDNLRVVSVLIEMNECQYQVF